MDGLKQLHAEHRLSFHGTLVALQNRKAFAAWLRPLFRSQWVVYSKRPFGGAQHALRYLGQYTHRVAISNHRLVALADGMVTFRWRDSAHKNRKRLMTLPANEFLRRFLLHVLPPGFVRIRHFGFLAHRRRRASLALCLRLLAESGRVQAETGPEQGNRSCTGPLWTCPQCGGPMVLIEKLTSMQLRLRSPPVVCQTMSLDEEERNRVLVWRLYTLIRPCARSSNRGLNGALKARPPVWFRAPCSMQ